MDSLFVAERVAESTDFLGGGNAEALQQIVRDAVRVVEEVGFRCPSERVRTLLEETELAALDETTGHLHILADLVHRCLESTPKTADFWLPFQSYGIGGTAPYFRNDDNGELEAARSDLIEKLARRVEELGVVDFSGRGVRLADNAAAIEIMASGTAKTIYFGAHEPHEIELADRLSCERGKLFVIWDVIQSPLTLSDHMVDGLFDCVERGVPVCLASMPMAAVSGPFSMSGLLTLAFAEFLVALVIVQTLHPGLLTICGAFPVITRIDQNYAGDFGGKYHNIANMLMSHLPRMLDLPACQSGCTTSEKAPTERAFADAAQGYAIFKRYGCHMVRHAFGFTKDLIAFSFEKLDRTAELFPSVTADQAPELRPLAYDEQAVDVIAKNGSHANYMQDDHTVRHIGREFVD